MINSIEWSSDIAGISSAFRFFYSAERGLNFFEKLLFFDVKIFMK